MSKSVKIWKIRGFAKISSNSGANFFFRIHSKENSYGIYTRLEKRVQQGKNDNNPQHDVMKLRIDKEKYLYFVPRCNGKYEFYSNDVFIQAKIHEYNTQVLNKKPQCFRVLDRVKSVLEMTSNQVQSATHTKPHSNPSFKGGLYLYDTLSGKDYAFTSEVCVSKKAV